MAPKRKIGEWTATQAPYGVCAVIHDSPGLLQFEKGAKPQYHQKTHDHPKGLKWLETLQENEHVIMQHDKVPYDPSSDAAPGANGYVAVWKRGPVEVEDGVAGFELTERILNY